jgi:DNA-binding IclR family transcriptional regulator
MAGRSATPGRSVTSRALAILDAFDTASPRLSLSEIAERSGTPLTTAHRMLGELTGWGALVRRPDGRYEIGPKLWDLGLLAPVQLELREVAAPFLMDVHTAIRDTVHLAVRDGLSALYVERVMGRESVPVVSTVGSRLPLHATGVGKVLLAHAPPEVLSAVVTGAMRRYTPYTVVAPGHLRRALADVRRTGVAYAREEMTMGSLSVAAPVVGQDETVVAALAVVIDQGRADLRRLALAVRTAAISTSRALQERQRLTTPR